ncbi:MAG: glycosyltransferase, partial [Acidilobus sp.]
NDDAVVVNFSQAFLVNADVYYAQGPITRALDDMYPEMRPLYRAIYRTFRRLFILHDRRFNRGLRRASRLFIANSSFTRSMYEAWGIRVDGVIYPPLDTSFFRPITSRPSGDYVLTYAGKETAFSVIRRVADAGVKIRAFGSKISHVPDYIRKHPNIELLGRVSDEELVELYSNALFTLFPFTHEPFGYVPVESMACGTPVLTYAAQGPGETVIHGVTGWLAKDEGSLVDMAVRIWREGYPSDMRARSRERAEQFDTKVIADKWLEVLKGVKG